MDRKAEIRASKFLALILRHQPDAAGIALDAEGWAEIGKLLAGMKSAGTTLTRAELEAIVAADDKGRYVISADGRRIRAAQGHSLSVDLALEMSTPPEKLYHGTARDRLDSIRATGLHSGSRRHVHLSNDIETAITVGSRHGVPVVLAVAARRLSESGQAFFLSQNGVWLTGPIAPAFIDWTDLHFADRRPRGQ